MLIQSSGEGACRESTSGSQQLLLLAAVRVNPCPWRPILHFQTKSVSATAFLWSSAMNSKNSLAFTLDLQPGKSAEPQTPDGHISQIPGLSPSVISHPEEKARGKRVTVQESDSDYVKLAKQGGHKGLLWHEETSHPNSSKPPNMSSGNTVQPSKEEKNLGAFQPLETPFWTDSMMSWERGDGSRDGKEKSPDVKSNLMNELQRTSPFETSKYKRVVFDKKPAPVDMSKLLSFGYAEDNKPAQ
ncbi:uncharacterized protein C7orf57 [Austrofundulus limnaeus]|uniref:Uncharacterized protein C7orf57 n=1 Tax=Austrofundulus limnaeus TaxID=52670 RepID=A0A2I4BWL7_AUSLI|nr:PREDICTED: uncharacterized protein C7orf57-like [Austrofundulus limnaeus]